MVSKAREHLARLREDPSSWSKVDYVEIRDEHDEQFDRNADAREAVLQALQVDRRPEDAALLRHLLAQEVLAPRSRDMQMLMDALPLACFLVGSLRAVEDVVCLA